MEAVAEARPLVPANDAMSNSLQNKLRHSTVIRQESPMMHYIKADCSVFPG